MKKILLLLALSVGYSNYSSAQRSCSTMENLDRLVKNDPRLEERMQNMEVRIQNIIRQQKLQGGVRAEETITIPVVFHVVYNTSAENIPDAQVLSQLTVLQDDFTKQNPDHTNTPSEFASLVADMNINFVLADEDPTGAAHSGITRTYTNKSSFGTNDDMKYTSRGGHDAWPSDRYLNFWICDLGSTLLGYAQFPGGPAATDGVVCHYKYTGTEGATAPYDKGRTATHEVGHWLNLRHIWGDATCGDDLVADTPTQLTSNSGCPSHPHSSCTSNDMFMNYMDYVNDACMYMFSEGQKERARALFAPGGDRESFANPVEPSNYCASKGNSVADEWIANVSVGNYSHTTGANGGYADFSSTEIINLTPGANVNVSLSPDFSATNYNEYWKIWIDYNGDFDFVDAGELVYDAGSLSSGTVTGSFTVPANASGSTVMRVSMRYNEAQGPCESFSYGEVEDYGVIFGTPDPCAAPSNVSHNSVSQNSFTISWSAAPNAVSYDVQHRASGGSWTTNSTSNTSYSVSGLNAETNYEYRVRTVCSHEPSAYSAIGNVTTNAAPPEVCDAPTGVSSSNTTTSSFDLTWNNMTNAVSYDVDYRESGQSTWSTSNTGTNSITLSGLNSETVYEYRLRTKCSEGNSGYTSISSVTTDTPAPPAYCASSGSAGSEWIERVTAGNITNNSDSDNGYGDHTNFTVNTEQGSSFNVVLNPGFTSSLFFGENTQPEYWRIYIDFNQDMDFNDPGELAFDAGGTSTGNVSGTVNIPESALVGNTRMRISMKRNSGADACGNIGSGEVEDYNVYIASMPSPTCDYPLNLNTTGVSQTEFTLNWTSATHSTSFIIKMREQGNVWNTYNTSANSYTFTGLSASTTYDFKIASECDGLSTVSGFTSVGSVTTASVAPPSYCLSNGDNTSDEWINSISIGNLSNNSGDNGGYADFTSMFLNTNTNAAVSFTLTPGFQSSLFGTSSYPEYWRIWIDYNQDGDFDDAGELAFDAGSTSESAVSGSFTIPASATSGNTRMRVTMSYNEAHGSCGSFGYGEVEDYTVAINTGARLISEQTNQISSSNMQINMFPNPTKGVVTLTGIENTEIVILDITGRIIYSGISEESNISLNTEAWNSGVYVVNIKQQENSKQLRLIVE